MSAGWGATPAGTQRFGDSQSEKPAAASASPGSQPGTNRPRIGGRRDYDD